MASSPPAGSKRPAQPSDPGEAEPTSSVATAFIAFDILREGDTDLRDRPLTERRAVLERLFRPNGLAGCFGSARRSAARPSAPGAALVERLGRTDREARRLAGISRANERPIGES